MCQSFGEEQKISYFEDIINKRNKKVHDLASKLLSKGGKLILVKHALENMPIYLLYSYSLLKSGLDKMK